jgi:hypothetical protein
MRNSIPFDGNCFSRNSAILKPWPIFGRKVGSSMGKFRLRLKVQALEVEIDGEREDLPAITSAINRQLGGLVDPVEVAANGHKQLSANDKGQVIDATDLNKKGSRRPRGNGARNVEGASALEFRHDAGRYGNPLQSWSLTEKSIWLLSVVKGIVQVSEVSGPQIAATFNQYFKQTGRIHPPHVTRELGKLKVQNPAPIGEDKNLYYLTSEGEKQAQKLTQDALNQSAA